MDKLKEYGDIQYLKKHCSGSAFRKEELALLTRKSHSPKAVRFRCNSTSSCLSVMAAPIQLQSHRIEIFKKYSLYINIGT